MVISHQLVDAIYAMEPPGRFLKKCASTGEWTELSRKEASNKAAQAMAYAVRSDLKLKSRIQSASQQPRVKLPKERSSSASNTSASAATSLAGGGDANLDDGNVLKNPLSSYDLPSLQQQLLQMQRSQSRPTFPSLGLTAPLTLNELLPLARAQLISQAQIQQLYHQQQQQELSYQYLLGQHTLQPQTQVTSSSPLSSISAPGTPSDSDILRQAILLRSIYGGGAQPLSSVQSNARTHLGVGLSNVCMPNQPTFGAATALQGGQLLDQVQRAAILRNLFAESSLAATSSQPQSQSRGLPLHLLTPPLSYGANHQVMELLQRNSQSKHFRPNKSADDVKGEFREDSNDPPLSSREGKDEGADE
jgi:hypothetical protein